jgi:hypothetical protein
MDTPPTSTPGEVRQYRREPHEKIDALPYADVPATRTPIVTEPTNGEPIDSDDEPLGASTYTEPQLQQVASYSLLKHLQKQVH